MEKTYKMWHVIIAFILGGVIVGGISFVPSFGTKGFFQKNVGEEAVSEAVGEVGGDILNKDGGESLTDSAEVGTTSEAGGESASGGAESETGLENGGFNDEATAGITRKAEVNAGAVGGISRQAEGAGCANIDAKVAAAQKILDEAMANYSKEVQAEAYDDFVDALKKKNQCLGG